ncbi:hypothetical protein VCV18_003506 [Metarhizium anisopliae]
MTYEGPSLLAPGDGGEYRFQRQMTKARQKNLCVQAGALVFEKKRLRGPSQRRRSECWKFLRRNFSRPSGYK